MRDLCLQLCNLILTRIMSLTDFSIFYIHAPCPKLDSKGEKYIYRTTKRRQAKTNDIGVIKCIKDQGKEHSSLGQEQ